MDVSSFSCTCQGLPKNARITEITKCKRTNDCLLTANRIVIPKSQSPGQTRIKMLARSYVYWPSSDADTESLVRNCTTCAMVEKNPVKVELNSWPKPTAPRT
ncbi:hypothetical protein Y032_0380g340 [Ancylostoma ceylanicum]|uniref:RNA-directed DNA polymerase n=1 Tax=Ancylostoma ceylanicum TaxID=53326 RepID=A0A016RTD6_9BILA|nr:hypothetical protein Y032_0380g340 [Ancylostoma ceylanicum]